jgi:hypothetical protein
VRRPNRLGGSITAAIASGMVAWLAIAPVARAAWQSRGFDSPLGDKATGIAVVAEGSPDFALTIGCDGERGDRWRGAALLRSPSAPPLDLENPVPGPVRRQRVRVALGDGPAVEDSFQIAKTAVGGTILWVPEPSKFTARLLAEEKKAPGAALRIELRRKDGQPLQLVFPLAGVGAEFAKLSPRCRDWQP